MLLWATLGAQLVIAADFEFVVIGDTRPRFESENFRLFEGLIAKINAPRSFVLLGRVLATLAGLFAKYRPRIQLHVLIARHLAAAIA